MKLAVRIQHHPSRNVYLKILLSLLDKKTNLQIIEDNISTWSGCQKAIKSLGPKDTHLLVLQDDILICKDFIKTVEQIATLGVSPVTFFSNREVVRNAIRFQTNWVKIHVWYMAQAYLLPRDMAFDFLEWSNRHCKPLLVDDERLAMYFYYHGLPVYSTSPNLVDHLGWFETTIGNRDNFDYRKIVGRVSQYFIGVEESGLSIDWKNTLNRPLIDEYRPPSLFVENYIE